MPALNWGLIQDGGVFESLMHALLFAEDPHTILFGRPGKDAGQDARSANGTVVYQSKYRAGLDMDIAVNLASEELEKIKKYREPSHANYRQWQNAQQWVMFANLSINPNDNTKWQAKVVPVFQEQGLNASFWGKEIIEAKLAARPEVSDVFFGQENRVLVGLKEARDLLNNECIGSLSLDLPMIGRDAEIIRVKAFAASPDKRVLPLIGRVGIGKSRLLYESLVSLSHDGWRVLWGLPGAMAKSSQWFRLLNGAQQTCVALDDPDDPGLLRAAIEQLSAVERRNWRIIIACRTDKSESLRRYQTNRSVDDPIQLHELNESDSYNLVKSHVGAELDPTWLHSVYRFTRGIAGWLCLIAELAKQGRLRELPPRADDIAAIYVDSCLESFDDATAMQARTLLRWLALWGTLTLEAGGTEREEIQFLETEGTPKIVLYDLLKRLVNAGLVRNWGIGKRLYAVEPLTIRQHLLSEWLLREDARGECTVNPAGAELVSKLVSGQLPFLDATLYTLSHLACSRLTTLDAFSFLRPVFIVLAANAEQADLLSQNHIAELVAKLGAADPDSALDVLTIIRVNVKGDQEFESSFWGKQTFTRSKLLSTLSWTLFTLSEFVDNTDMGHRYIMEFRELAALIKAGVALSDPGKSPLQLLKRLLCDSRRTDAFAPPAYEMVLKHLILEDWWPFVGELAKCLLEPIRETTEWVANWTIVFSQKAILPDSPNWERALGIRAKLFETLRAEHPAELRIRIWPLLAASHHSMHYAIHHGYVRGAFAEKYRSVLTSDLTESLTLLGMSRSLAEATYARELWEWYLKYGREDDLLALARKCEQLYNDVSKWRLHEFFRFDRDDLLAPETRRIADILRQAGSPNDFKEFFAEARKYLAAARKGRGDLADNGRISDLAKELSGLFSVETNESASPLSDFVISVLRQPDNVDPLARLFSLAVCRNCFEQVKASSEEAAPQWLEKLLALTPVKAPLLLGIYANAHPSWTGRLTDSEIQYILANKDGFSKRDWFWLLGIIVGTGDDSVFMYLESGIDSLRNDTFEASECLIRFIDASYMTFRRYAHTPSQSLIEWIISTIGRLRLNGSLLQMYELEQMRDLSGFRPSMGLFTTLMASRVEIDGGPDLGDRFEILPHDFKANDWCTFDGNNLKDMEAFYDLCRLALGSGFTAAYWIPKYLVQIDPEGTHVAAFVAKHLADNPTLGVEEVSRLAYLASEYPDESKAWADIATPICVKARGMRRDDREHIFFGLSRKETGVMVSHPGEVPHYYTSLRDTATRLLKDEPADSPLRSYREWSLNCAEESLRREEGRAEELDNG